MIYYEKSTMYTWERVGEDKLKFIKSDDNRYRTPCFKVGDILEDRCDKGYVDRWIQDGKLVPIKESIILEILKQVDEL